MATTTDALTPTTLYPSIGAFHAVCKQAEKYPPSKPLRFQGTVKTHGTHGDILFGDEIQSQSRKRILSEQSDNYKFCTWINSLSTNVRHKFMSDIRSRLPTDCTTQDVIVAGEWCGKGVQHGVGISEFSRFWVFYDVFYLGEDGHRKFIPIDAFQGVNNHDAGIWNVLDFQSFDITIDFSDPDEIKEIIIPQLERITAQVEKACPVAHRLSNHHGGSAEANPKLTGEGIVWKCVTPGYYTYDWWFKVKGEEHKVNKEGVVMSREKVHSINQFIHKTATVARFEQGVSELSGGSGKFDFNKLCSWVWNDILKENSDLMAESRIENRDVAGKIRKRVIQWCQKRQRETASS